VRVETLGIDRAGRIVSPEAAGPPAAGAVRIWRLQLDAVAPHEALPLLSDGERARAAAIVLPVRARHFIAAHAGARVALAACSGRSPAELVFEAGAHGKPRLAGAGGLRFSLSHSGDWGVIGVSGGGEIGVDVERLRSDLDLERLVRRVFSPREAERWQALAAREAGPATAAQEHRRRCFFRAWVRKEAYAKARGEGLARGLGSFSVEIGEEAPRLLEDQRDPAAPERWELHDLAIAPGYAGAAAIERA
jgi:4'-phosphopantetheinyl transferase